MFFWRYYRLRRTTLISIGCFSFLCGLALAKVGVATTNILLIGLAFVLILCCRTKWWIVALPAVVLVGMLIGIWRGSHVDRTVQLYQHYIGQTVTLQGIIRDDPTYGDKGQLDMRLHSVVVHDQPLLGTVRLTSYALLQPKRGDKLTIRGKLYAGFGSWQAAMYFGTIQTLQVNTAWHETARHYFTASILQAIPEPQASLGLGFLVGLKSQLPDTLSDQLKILGLTHIVVASGYNLTVLVRVSRRLLVGYSKYLATLLSVGLMSSFLFITGFSPSMTRAALVTSLVLLAWYYGRHIHPICLLLVAAAVTTMYNPLYLWTDLGWWLSFLAFAGVMLMAPLLQHRVYSGQEPPLYMQIAIETFCAQLVTLPLILCIFGQLSVLSLLANVLIVPLIPLVMALTAVAGVVMLIVPALGAWAALPASLLLSFITMLTGYLSNIPWAQIPFSISVSLMIFCYACILIFGVSWYSKTDFSYTKTSLID